MNIKDIKKIEKDTEYGWLKGKLLSSRTYPEFFKINKEERVINIGSGDGPQAIVYDGNYKEMLGVEINKERAERSEKIVRHYGANNYQAISANVESIPKADKSFDKAIAIDIIEHVEHPDILCQEIHRLLKKDGEVLITFPAMHDKFTDFASWVGRTFFGRKKKAKSKNWNPDEHNQDYPVKKWIKIVEKNGFRLVRSRASTLFPPLHLYGMPRFWYNNNLIHKIDSCFCKLPIIKNYGQALICHFKKR